MLGCLECRAVSDNPKRIWRLQHLRQLSLVKFKMLDGPNMNSPAQIPQEKPYELAKEVFVGWQILLEQTQGKTFAQQKL